MKTTTSSPLGPRLDIADVLENSPPELDFVLPGLPSGTVGMLTGAGGVGKTMFELQLAVVLAAGLPWRLAPLSALLEFDEERRPERVLLLLAEESQVRHLPAQIGPIWASEVQSQQALGHSPALIFKIACSDKFSGQG